MVGDAPFTYRTSGRVHQVAMTLVGFVTWEQMVRLAPRQRVKVTLRKPLEKKPNILINGPSQGMPGRGPL